MVQYILRRLALLIPVLLGVSLVVFTLVRLIPGDATLLAIGMDQRITAEQRELVRKSYGLDQPQPVQYARWMEHVLQGDLGTSLRTRRSVNEELRLRLPVTVELTLLAALLGTIPAMAVGVVAAVRRNSALDYAATIGTLIGVSVPNFPLAAVLMRNTRSAVLEVLSQEHVRVARAKGLTERRVLGRHVILNASLPILTVVGIQVASLLGGTVIIETIFALPGIGRYIYEAIANRDYPVVQGVTIVIAAIFVVVSMTVDILYAVLDPRLRTQ